MKRIKVKELDYIYKVSEMDILYNTKVKASERIKVTDSVSMAKMFRERIGRKIEYCEQSYIALFNRNMQVLGVAKLGDGSSCECIVNTKKAFQLAILCNADAIALCHNHPSGNVQPSEIDRKLTFQVREICEFLGITLVDHLIVTDERYYSFRDNSLIKQL